MNGADKTADLMKEVRKDMSLGETETEDDTSSEEESDYLSDGTLTKDASCSSGSEEELSCSGDSKEEPSHFGGSEEKHSRSRDSDEELSCSDDSEEELSCSGDSEEELSCSDGSEDELSEGEHRSTGLERECSEEDSLQILNNQSSSDESVQKIDVTEAAERKRLWEEEIKAYYDR